MVDAGVRGIIAESSLFMRGQLRSAGASQRGETLVIVLTGERLALLALDKELAALQAGSRAAFFNAIAVMHEPLWPPAPFELASFDWAQKNLAHDPDGQGWYGWALLANEGERSPPRLVGIAALIGRPDDDGDVELAFGLLPEYRGSRPRAFDMGVWQWRPPRRRPPRRRGCPRRAYIVAQWFSRHQRAALSWRGALGDQRGVLRVSHCAALISACRLLR